MEIFTSLLFVLVSITCYFLNRLIIKINKALTLFSIVSHIRNKRNYIENFNYTLTRKEGETDNEYIERSEVNKHFEADLIKEKQAVKAILERIMSKSTVKEIDDILKSVYE